MSTGLDFTLTTPPTAREVFSELSVFDSLPDDARRSSAFALAEKIAATWPATVTREAGPASNPWRWSGDGPVVVLIPGKLAIETLAVGAQLGFVTFQFVPIAADQSSDRIAILRLDKPPVS